MASQKYVFDGLGDLSWNGNTGVLVFVPSDPSETRIRIVILPRAIDNISELLREMVWTYHNGEENGFSMEEYVVSTIGSIPARYYDEKETCGMRRGQQHGEYELRTSSGMIRHDHFQNDRRIGPCLEYDPCKRTLTGTFFSSGIISTMVVVDIDDEIDNRVIGNIFSDNIHEEELVSFARQNFIPVSITRYVNGVAKSKTVESVVRLPIGMGGARAKRKVKHYSKNDEQWVRVVHTNEGLDIRFSEGRSCDKTYHFDGLLPINLHEFLRNGRLEGVRTITLPDGTIRERKRYFDGKLAICERFDGGGKVVSYRTYDENGLLCGTMRNGNSYAWMKNGKFDGINVNDNVDVITISFWKDGKLDGPFVKIAKHSGRVVERRCYYNGLCDGVSEKYDADGNLTERRTYRHGMLDGPFFLSSGGMVVHCFFLRGLLSGKLIATITRIIDNGGFIVEDMRCFFSRGIRYGNLGFTRRHCHQHYDFFEFFDIKRIVRKYPLQSVAVFASDSKESDETTVCVSSKSIYYGSNEYDKIVRLDDHDELRMDMKFVNGLRPHIRRFFEMVNAM
jgi:antitoxin component YwqK of YwqJK toxin-antitoxin module